MKTFTIKKQDGGQRLNRFLEKTVPALYPSLMHKYLRTKRIKLNGGRAGASSRLSEGDVLELYIPDDFLEEGKNIPDFMHAKPSVVLLYEDENIALISKPAGLLSHDGDTKNPDTAINRYLRCLFERGDYVPDASESFTPALCNRLDRGTAGIVIAAKTRPALLEMNAIIKNRLAEKYYLAAVISEPPKDGRYTAWLKKSETGNIVSVSGHPVPGGKEIITEFETVARSGNLRLLLVRLVTGRTHQIRAHLRYLGCPLLGDGKYGNGAVNRQYSLKRQALAAFALRFDFDARQYPALGYLSGQSFFLCDVWFAETFFPSVRLESVLSAKNSTGAAF